jgi:CheY-like chemotaxis protein
MTMDFKVFVVEDDPLLREMMEMILAEDCEVVSFASAEACLEGLRSVRPDMFLLDVRLPGMDGHDFCRRLKADFDTADIPVTFVSGLDDIDARLASYDAGGEDFICKPFDPVELQHKITLARRIAVEKRQLREMAGFAQRTAFTAMTGMSELGIVIEFLRKSFACTTGIELARQILDALAQYGLKGAVQVRADGRDINLGEDGTDLPLETSVLNHLRNQGRIFEFKNRGVYNYGGITILVNNMPTEDAERCGRLRDDLAILAEGADARRQSIEIEASNSQTKTGIGATLEELHAMLLDFTASQTTEQEVTAAMATEMQGALINAFVSLGLTEGQEETLNELIRHYFDSLRVHNKYGTLLLQRLGQIAERLKSLA